MKNKFSLIFKNSLINNYKLKKITKRKILLIGILLVYVFASIFMLLNDFFSNMYELFSKANLSNYYLTIIFSLTSIFTFFFTIFSAKNALFENKDNDLLFSLPLTKKTILLSRLANILIYNFLLGLLIIIPGIYVYLSNEILTFQNLIVIVFLTLFSSIIPTIISCLFGYFIAFITSKSRHKNIIELISYALFIGIYMLVIYKGNIILDLFINNPKMLTTILKSLFFPIYLINLSITKNNLLYIIGYILINLSIIYLFILLLDRVYYKLIVKLKTEKTVAQFKLKSVESNSIMTALIKKELKRYFSSAIYVFNTSFGLIILIIASIASFFCNPNDLLVFIGNDLSLNSFMLVFYLILFAIGFSVTTNSSISIERNNFWILKMLPITSKQIFKAKKMVNLILLIPISIIGLIIFNLSGYITVTEMIYLMVTAILFSIVIANFGLICNLLFPKFDAANDTVIVKQSLSSLMGIMGPLIVLVIYVVIVNTFEWSLNLLLSITIILIIVLLVITSFILHIWGTKRYKTLK